MPVPQVLIERNLAHIRGRIEAAAHRVGRNPREVQLVAVTKTVGIEEIQALRGLGVTDFGENRIEPAQAKIEAVGRAVVWHMIGTVQRRKCPDIVRWFDRVDAVDRLAVAEALDRHCRESGREEPLPVLVEVNVSGEASKHGFAPGELPDALAQMRNLDYVRVDGVLTMAPFVDDPEDTRPVFARLRRLAVDHGLTTLSMGMTNDFEVAIEEGATQVRIGSALFKQ